MVIDYEFAVVDLETTGLFPDGNDRIVEIAAIRLDCMGNVVDDFASLVNPNRDVGPTYIHGISAKDVIYAPSFEEIAGDFLSILSGAVLVAHNVNFDKRFIHAEMNRIGCMLPDFPVLCTMWLAYRTDPSIPSRKLEKICKYYNIPLDNPHEACSDLSAVASLFMRLLKNLGDPLKLSLAEIGVQGTPIKKDCWPCLPLTGKYYRREKAIQKKEKEISYIEQLVSKLPITSPHKPEVEEYFALIDRVLEDRSITLEEFKKLQIFTEEVGISREQAIEAHLMYMRDLITVALEDDIITESEKNDLNEVRRLLAIPHVDYDNLLVEIMKNYRNGKITKKSTLTREEIKGKTICFTGTMRCQINGEHAHREVAKKAALDCEMIVINNVKRNLDFLVVADPDSMSGKAKKAREHGIRIIAESVFWRMVGINVE